jgi:hypothetical protein
VSFLFVMPLYALFIASLLFDSRIFTTMYPSWVLWIGLFNLLVGNALLQRSPNILLIPGTSSTEHLRENVVGADLTLSDDELAELDKIGH